MTRNDLQIRAGVFGTGLLFALVIVVAHLPLVLLVLPFVMIFLSIVADMQELCAAWFGMLNSVGIFDPAVLTDPEQAIYSERRD
jgi:hypothetical protein